ncbi:MAG: hypothetical protein KTR27_00590 [Leptolyngbyaceae cyanobacterium MAG.088]|nr:hypothetical protein [Leptolyngbyaceae cyanobacterium MAG.088]
MDPALETAPCGYLRLSATGIIEAVNQTLGQWIGTSIQVLEGQKINKLLPKSGQIFFQSHVFPQLKLSGELEECYFELRSHTGDRIPILANFRRATPKGANIQPSKLEEDRQKDLPTYDVILMRVHKRKDLENALVQAKRQTDEAVESLKQSNDALSRFSGMVAHDLKSSIRQMKIFSQLAIANLTDVLDDRSQDILNRLNHSADRAVYFVDKLLEYGSLEAIKGPLKPVDLNSTVEVVSKTLGDLITETSATINVGNLPTVLGLETQLVQLFQNLINNALKYRAPDRQPAIEIKATRTTNTEWTIWVQDNGMGISPKYQDRIFDILYRLHGSDYEGAGIGLATCQWIVRNHHGTIGVESQLGQGSRFYFTVLSADVDL